MKSLRHNLEAPQSWPNVVASEVRAFDEEAHALAPARWDWREVRRVLVVRLRSIGDTVLATPSLYALRRFLPRARIDVLLEDWVAPLLDGFDCVDNVITVERGSTSARVKVARQLRANAYDVAYNLHGGTTASLLTRASGARHRVGYAAYQYSSLHNHLSPSSSELWGREKTHAVEQQLALLGWTGVPVSDRPRTRLAVTEEASRKISERLRAAGFDESQSFALVHPVAAFDTKQWATENFARVIEWLHAREISSIAIATPKEANTISELQKDCSAPHLSFTDLSLPEVTALAARARVFVGNDSGIAHIAAAASAPAVVIFGSSNIAHWQPWASAPSATVREEMPCAPCPGYTCEEFGVAQCIRRVPVERVIKAIEQVLEESV